MCTAPGWARRSDDETPLALGVVCEMDYDTGHSTLQENDGSCRLVKRLLWSHIEERVPVSERDTIRRVVGEESWATNDALFTEAEALESILDDLEEDRGKTERSVALLQHPAKAMLEDRVLRLVEDIRQVVDSTAAICGDEHAARIASKYMPGSTCVREKQVLEYVTRNNGNGAMSTGRSRPCTPSTPSSSRGASRLGSRAPSSLSNGSDMERETAIESFAPSLSAFRIDEIAGSLRDALDDERRLLEDDIKMMHELLYAESEATAIAKPPGVDELQILSTKLEECRDEAMKQAAHAERVVTTMVMPALKNDDSTGISGGVSSGGRRLGKVGRLRDVISSCRAS